jgi:hypothetical protein
LSLAGEQKTPRAVPGAAQYGAVRKPHHRCCTCEENPMSKARYRAQPNSTSGSQRGKQRYFPSGYRVAAPPGGYFLWVECAAQVDSLDLHRRALDLGISIAPGPIFSARQQFKNYLRLNTGHPWTNSMAQALQKLAQLLRRY